MSLLSFAPTLLVALGAALGGVGRHLIAQAMATDDPRSFPWATLVVNVSGCLLIGLLAPWALGAPAAATAGEATTVAASPTAWQTTSRWFLMVGVLGGFTTFSTFGLDALRLFQQGLWGATAGYLAASLIGSLAAVGLGWLMGAAITR